MTPGTGTGFPSGCDLLCIVVFHQGPKRFLDAIPYVDLVSLRSGMANMSAVDTAIPHIYIYTVCVQTTVCSIEGKKWALQHHATHTCRFCIHLMA